MKKSLLNLGRTLNKTEQKQINGGFTFTHLDDGNGEKKKGELCIEGSSLPHLSCISGLTCVAGAGPSPVGLCQ